MSTGREGVVDPGGVRVRTGREGVVPGGVADAGPVNLVPALAGRYVPGRYVDGGGEGHVLRVSDADGGQFVVKQYSAGWTADALVLQRLLDARAGFTRDAWVSDPRMRSVLWLQEWGVDPQWDMSYEVQEFLAMGSLAEPGALTRWSVPELVRALADAVQGFHDVVGAHRDVKPDNVMVRFGDGPVLVLTDVGLARVVGQQSKHYSRRDGTAAFQAPEAAHGAVALPGDWWSVGMIVAQAALGIHPLALAEEVMPDERVIQAELASRDVPGLDQITDPRVRLLCQGLLTRDDQKRWGRAQIDQWLAGQSPATAFGQAVALPRGSGRTSSVRFAQVDHRSVRDLASAMAADPDQAGGLLFEQRDSVLRGDMRAMLKTQGLDAALDAIEGYTDGPWQETFLRALQLMDPDLEPRLSGQLMTPTAIGQLAQDVINAGQASPAQTKAMSWVIDHKVWTLWRDLPHMTNAATTHEHLTIQYESNKPYWEAAGASRSRHLLVASDGTVQWSGGSRPDCQELIDANTSTLYYDEIVPLARAWRILFTLAPREAAQSVQKSLNPFVDDLGTQQWWRVLVSNQDPSSQMVALLSKPLAEQGERSLLALQQSALENRALARAQHIGEARAALQTEENQLRRAKTALANQKGKDRSTVWIRAIYLNFGFNEGIGCGVYFLAYCLYGGSAGLGYGLGKAAGAIALPLLVYALVCMAVLHHDSRKKWAPLVERVAQGERAVGQRSRAVRLAESEAVG